MKTFLNTLMAVFAIFITKPAQAGEAQYSGILAVQAAVERGEMKGKHNLVYIPCKTDKNSPTGMCESNFSFSTYTELAEWSNGRPEDEVQAKQWVEKKFMTWTEARELMSYCGRIIVKWEDRSPSPAPRPKVIVREPEPEIELEAPRPRIVQQEVVRYVERPAPQPVNKTLEIHFLNGLFNGNSLSASGSYSGGGGYVGGGGYQEPYCPPVAQPRPPRGYPPVVQNPRPNIPSCRSCGIVHPGRPCQMQRPPQQGGGGHHRTIVNRNINHNDNFIVNNAPRNFQVPNRSSGGGQRMSQPNVRFDGIVGVRNGN